MSIRQSFINRSPARGGFDRPTSMSEDEIEDLREAFNLYDTEGTGYIDPKELCSIMQILGKHYTLYRYRYKEPCCI